MQAVNMYPEDQSSAQPDMPKSIALFDFSHAINVAFNAAGPDSTADIVIGWLRAQRSSCDRVVLCLDSKPYWRTKVFEGYKAGRKQEPELANIWDRVLDQVIGEGFAVARADGEEADDVMASLARIYVEDYACEDVRLVTADKDISQCLNNHVRWFYPQMGSGEFEIRDADWCKRHWGGVDWANEKQIKEGPAPEEIARVLSIMGDTSDKIPGIKGIGIKGALWLVRTFGTPAKMAEGLVAEQQVAKNKGKELSAFWRNFAAGMAELPKWIKLTTVNDDVQLDKHPMKYLERVEPRQLVAEDAQNDDGDPRFPDDALEDEVDWEFIAEQTAAKEREELAKALPVEPAPKHDPSKMVIGKDPKAEEALRALAAKTAPAASSGSTSASTTSAPAATTPPPAATTSTAPSHQPAKQPASQAAPSVAAVAAGSASAPSVATPPADAQASPSRSPANHNGAAELVPTTQGPAPRKLQDEITSTAIARVDPPSWTMATQPCSANEMLQIAKVYMNSRFYSQYGTPQGVFAVCQLGRELGLGVAASVESFHIVDGKPFPKATTLRALAERHPDCEWLMVVSADETQATVKTKHRKAGELTYQYTIERAEKAGYLTGKNKHNWIGKTQEMLEARATSKAVRRWYPGAILGLHSEDEARDFD
jgi:5'-3' exonuclease